MWLFFAPFLQLFYKFEFFFNAPEESPRVSFSFFIFETKKTAGQLKVCILQLNSSLTQLHLPLMRFSESGTAGKTDSPCPSRRHKHPLGRLRSTGEETPWAEPPRAPIYACLAMRGRKQGPGHATPRARLAAFLSVSDSPGATQGEL